MSKTFDDSHLHRATLNPRTVKQMQMNSNTRREKNAERQKALALPKYKGKEKPT